MLWQRGTSDEKVTHPSILIRGTQIRHPDGEDDKDEVDEDGDDLEAPEGREGRQE